MKKDNKSSACATKRTSIGGQALIEGIMMRGPKLSAMAVRNPDGEIVPAAQVPWSMTEPESKSEYSGYAIQEMFNRRYQVTLRIEKLDGCCATFRVLIANDDGTYTSTDSFFTMNLECICCIRCLGDVFIENV